MYSMMFNNVFGPNIDSLRECMVPLTEDVTRCYNPSHFSALKCDNVGNCWCSITERCRVRTSQQFIMQRLFLRCNYRQDTQCNFARSKAVACTQLVQPGNKVHSLRECFATGTCPWKQLLVKKTCNQWISDVFQTTSVMTLHLRHNNASMSNYITI